MRDVRRGDHQRAPSGDQRNGTVSNLRPGKLLCAARRDPARPKWIFGLADLKPALETVCWKSVGTLRQRNVRLIGSAPSIAASRLTPITGPRRLGYNERNGIGRYSGRNERKPWTS